MSSDAPSLRESPKWWSAEPRHDRGRALYIDRATLETPTNGDCLCDAWWSIHPVKGVAFYYQPFGYTRSEEPSPQCNAVEMTARLLTDRGWPEHSVEQIPVAYLTHARRAMIGDRRALESARNDGASQKARAIHPQEGGEPNA